MPASYAPPVDAPARPAPCPAPPGDALPPLMTGSAPGTQPHPVPLTMVSGGVPVAVCQLRPALCRTSADVERALEGTFQEACRQGARILVLPEDLGLWMPMMDVVDRFRSLLTSWHTRPGAYVADLVGEPVGIRGRVRPTEPFVKGMPPSPAILDVPGHRGRIWDLFTRWSDAVMLRLPLHWLGDLWADRRANRAIQGAVSRLCVRYRIAAVGGTCYSRIRDPHEPQVYNGRDLYAVGFVYDSRGRCLGFDAKRHPVEIELAAGVTPSPAPPRIFACEGVRIGMMICNDVNDPALAAWYRRLGAQLLAIPSAGIVPAFSYPPDYDADVLRANVARGRETGCAVARSYQSGVLAGICFRGRCCLSDGGGIAAIGPTDRMDQPLVLTETLPLPG